MTNRLIKTAAAAALGLAAAGANATYVGTVPMGANDNNQVIAPLTKVEGWYGANLYLIGGPAQITATLIGSEARATNTFDWNGTTLFSTSGTNGSGVGTLGAPVGTSSVLNNVLSGLLPFAFSSTVANGDVANGANVTPNSGFGNFFISLSNCNTVACIDSNVDGFTPGSGKVAWLFLDDLGFGPDDNHDDLVVRLEITGGDLTVPAPAGLGLLGAGLLGLGIMRRRNGSEA